MSLESLIQQIKKDGQKEKESLRLEMEEKMKENNEKINASFQKLKKQLEADYQAKEKIFQNQKQTEVDFRSRMRQLVLKEALLKEAVAEAKKSVLASDDKTKILEKKLEQYEGKFSENAVIRSSVPLNRPYQQADLGWPGLIIENKGITVEINLEKLIDELVAKNSKEYMNILFS